MCNLMFCPQTIRVTQHPDAILMREEAGI